MKWRLYVKWPKQKQFKCVDWRAGRQVGNLIYATCFTDEEKSRVEDELQKTRDHNVGMEWEFRLI